MAFDAPFSRIARPPFGPGLATASAAVSWWLSGGIASANCVAAYQAKGSASYAASLVNLNNPGVYDLSDVGAAKTWSGANGWSGFTAANYFDSTIAGPKTQTYSMIARFATGSGSGVVCGAVSSGSFFFMLQPARTDSTAGYWNGDYSLVAPAHTAGTLAVCGSDGYRDGVDNANIASAGSSGTARTIFIGGWNNGVATCANPFPGYLYAVAIYSTVLTAVQVAAVHTAMMLL